MKRMLLILVLVLVALTVWTAPVFAAPATSKDITITATPSYVGIDITQNTWTVNGIDGGGFITKSSTYYSNATGATGDVTPPNNPVVDGDCYFTIANSSTVATDITGNLPTFVGGDAMTNTNTGYTTNGANAFGASTYISGAAWPGDAVILKDAASDAIKSNLAALTDLKFGVAIKIKSADFTNAAAMTGTLTVTAVVHT